MKLNIILLFTCVTILFTSCSTMKKSTSTTMTVESGIYQYPTVADLDVKQKVEKQITWNFKSNLVADIIKENKADVLLEPQVTFTKKSFGERTLTITGFPASFKNFRKANQEDLKALEIIIPAPKMEVYNVTQPWHKKFFSKKKK